LFIALIQAPIFSRRHIKPTQTVIDANQKETAIDQQYSCEMLICQRHQTILRLCCHGKHTVVSSQT